MVIPQSPAPPTCTIHIGTPLQREEQDTIPGNRSSSLSSLIPPVLSSLQLHLLWSLPSFINKTSSLPSYLYPPPTYLPLTLCPSSTLPPSIPPVLRLSVFILIHLSTLLDPFLLFFCLCFSLQIPPSPSHFLCLPHGLQPYHSFIHSQSHSLHGFL